MKLVLAIVLSLICTNNIAQKLKVKKKSRFNYQEMYTIDKKTKLKQGYYIKFNKSSKDTLVKGYYINDKKVNVWFFFGKNNNAYMQYDYDNNVAKLDNEVSVKNDSIQIRTGSVFQLSRVDVLPLFIGYENEIKSIIIQNFQPPSSMFKNELSGMAMASFVVNKTGQIQDISIENSFSEEISSAIEKSIKSIKGKWIPAKIKGNSVDSKKYIVYNISLTKDADYKHKYIYEDKLDLIVVDLIYFGVERERKVYSH